jgi:hypothetical protein
MFTLLFIVKHATRFGMIGRHRGYKLIFQRNMLFCFSGVIASSYFYVGNVVSIQVFRLYYSFI